MIRLIKNFKVRAMLRKKIIPLSLVLITSLYSQDVVLQELGVESTVITEVAQNAEVSADLAQALSTTVPSIDMNRRSGIANDIFIRGQKRDNISVEVDGTKVYGACPNRMDPPVSHILANQIESVEVIEGPYDVETYGTMSGGLKIKTKKPTKELHGELNLGMGSWGYKKVGATMSGGNDKVRMLVSASYENSGQYEDGDGNTIADQIDEKAMIGNRYKSQDHDMDAYTKKSIMTKMFIELVENQELRVSYTGNRSDDILYGNTSMDALYDDSNIYSVEYNIDNISDLYKNINLQYYASDVKHPMSTKFRNASNTPAKDITNELTTDMQGLKLKSTFDLSDYKFLIGLDGSERKWDGKYYNTTTGAALPTGNSKSIDNAKTKNGAIFTKLNKDFGALNINIGARYDDTKITHATMDRKDYSAISANIVTTYNINNDNKVFLGLGSASRVPDARELYFTKGVNMIGSPNLKQTTNNEVDLGYEVNSEDFTFKIKTFYSKLDDYIYIQKGVAKNAFENIDAYIYGGEISASYFATDDISLDTGISYKRGKKDEAMANQSDKDLSDIAPLRANVALNYEYANNSIATLEMQASDRWDKFDEDNGEQELAGWAVMNMKVKHALDKHAEFTIGINNVLDKTYAVSNTYADLTLISSGGEAILLNEPGRYFYTNLTFKF